MDDLTGLDILRVLRATPRSAALAEVARRLALAPVSSSPVPLAAHLGVSVRTLRRLLDKLDAAGVAVTVGWVRARGGGGVNARKALENKRKAKIDKGSVDSL